MAEEQERTASGQVGEGESLRVDVSALAADSKGVPAAEVEALRQSYLTHLEQAKHEHQAKLEEELGGLEKLAEKYQAEAEVAARTAGLDLDTMPHSV